MAGTAVVAYCWGPGCNRVTLAALEVATLGYPIKEMIGGYEYWVCEGLPVQALARCHPPVGRRPDHAGQVTGL